MTWTRLSDSFADSPQILALSDAAFRLHVTMLVWCNKQLTDGRVPARAVSMFSGGTDPTSLIRELTDAGLWFDMLDGSFNIDWADQEKAEAVRERQSAGVKRQQKHRERQKRHAQGDHSLCERCSYVVGNAGSNAVTNAARTPRPTGFPTRPDPTPREGRGGGARARENVVSSNSAEAPFDDTPIWTRENGWAGVSQ